MKRSERSKQHNKYEAQTHRDHIGELNPNIFDKDGKIDTLEQEKPIRQKNKDWLENASVEDVLIHQIKDKQLLMDKTKHKSLKKKNE